MRLGDGKKGRKDVCGIAGGVVGAIEFAPAAYTGDVGHSRSAAKNIYAHRNYGIARSWVQRIRPGAAHEVVRRRAGPTGAAGGDQRQAEWQRIRNVDGC